MTHPMPSDRDRARRFAVASVEPAIPTERRPDEDEQSSRRLENQKSSSNDGDRSTRRRARSGCTRSD
jgi:hypothetical protein